MNVVETSGAWERELQVVAMRRLARTIAHELGNLVTPLVGDSELLLRPLSEEERRESAEHVQRCVRQLSRVADRLRWEAGPRRVVATSKTFKQLARLTGAPPQRKGPFVRRTIALDGRAHTIVGVMPEPFWFELRETAMYLPLAPPRADGSRSARTLMATPRLSLMPTSVAAGRHPRTDDVATSPE